MQKLRQQLKIVEVKKIYIHLIFTESGKEKHKNKISESDLKGSNFWDLRLNVQLIESQQDDLLILIKISYPEYRYGMITTMTQG